MNASHRYYAEGKKPDTKDHILHGSIHRKLQEKKSNLQQYKIDQ